MPGYRCVIAGVHDSSAGERAVEMAGLLAAETDATLVLVAAYRAGSGAQADDPYQAVGAMAAKRVLRAGAARCTEMGAGYVPTFAVAGDTVTVLADAVGDHQADLLLVGSHGMPGVAGRLLGSARGGVAGEGDCDVLVVHTTTKRWHNLVSRRFRRARSGSWRTVMVGIGDSPDSMRAVEQAAVIAAVAGAEMVLVAGSASIETVLRDGELRARELGAESVTSVVAHGDAVGALLEAAERYKADLLVLGNRQFADGRLLDCVGTQISQSTPTHFLLVH